MSPPHLSFLKRDKQPHFDDGSIRPVSRRFPASQKNLDDSNLPLSVVLTPLAAAATKSSSQSRQEPLLLSSIPKCLHCGAPHANSLTHFCPKQSIGPTSMSGNRSSLLLCYLCGKLSSTRISEQYEKRAHAEGIDSNITTNNDSDDLYNATEASAYWNSRRRLKNDNSQGDSCVFQLPLRLLENQQQQQPVLYSVPALSCPPLWFIVLDGSCRNPFYWQTVSNLLLQTIRGGGDSTDGCLPMPNHVHLSLLIAGATTTTTTKKGNKKKAQRNNQRSSRNRSRRANDEEDENNTIISTSRAFLGLIQLTSPVPHVVHYHYSEDDDDDEYDQVNGKSDQQRKVRGGGGITDDSARRSPSTHELVTAIRNSLSHETTHLEAALRGLMEYMPPPAATTTSTTSATTETLSGSSSSSSSSNNISGLPLSWITELIVETLNDFGQPAGQRRELEMSAASAAAYAGAKITLLLANQPSGICHPTAPAVRLSHHHPQQQQQRGDPIGRGGVGGRIGYRPPGYRFGPIASPPNQNDYDDDENDVRKAAKSKREDDDLLDVEAGADNSDDEDGVTNSISASKQQQQDYEMEQHQQQESDLTPSSLQRRYHPIGGDGTNTDDHGNTAEYEVDIAVYFDELGRQCAQASVGVDLLFLLESKYNDESYGSNNNNNIDTTATYDPYYNSNNSEENGVNPAAGNIPDVGLALYSNLSIKSGAPGPLLFDLSSSESLQRLYAELKSRVPWQPEVVFGAELRLRLPPGFVVDDEPIEPVVNDDDGSDGPQLAPLYADNGLYGPASSVRDSTHLWRMGVCDPFTSVTVDLTTESFSGVVPDQLYVEGLGDIALQPVIQTCFAYTTIVPNTNPNEDATSSSSSPSFCTVRQMRVQSFPVGPLARDTEQLYDALDVEAMAVVLFHKLAIALFQDGVMETANIAEDWLQATLVSIYRSAERKAEAMASETKQVTAEANSTPFYIQERLLDRGGGGELSIQDILLAQGHNQLRNIPLLTYLLMQCDAFRPSSSTSFNSTLSTMPPTTRVTHDLRYAALAQIMSQSPWCLVRCIAPRLQLWASSSSKKTKGKKKTKKNEDDKNEEDELILDVMDLNAGAIRTAVMEFGDLPTSSSKRKKDDLMLFLDAPDQICVMDARSINSLSTAATRSATTDTSAAATAKNEAVVVGPRLRRVIEEARTSYRTPPPVRLECNDTAENEDAVIQILSDVLAEDAPSAAGHDNFAEWKADVADCVMEELDSR